MRVFLCSTCYDLIDLRTELEDFFRGAGLEPVLSDSLTSDFEVKVDCNSIETCLTNVRSCDAFVIILSNRYGPSLAEAGFGDISATHLEYREAVKCQKPVRMYIRDRLEADYAIWKRNGERETLKLAWCKESKDWKIFELLDEHRRLLESKPSSNWFWTFRSSVELKRRLTIDFRDAFARVTAHRLFENGRVPFLDVTGRYLGHGSEFVSIELTIRNLGHGCALRPSLRVTTTNNEWTFKSLAEQEQAHVKFSWGRWHGFDLNLPTLLSYSIAEGHQFNDHADLTVHLDPSNSEAAYVSYKLTSRQYVGAALELGIS